MFESCAGLLRVGHEQTGARHNDVQPHLGGLGCPLMPLHVHAGSSHFLKFSILYMLPSKKYIPDLNIILKICPYLCLILKPVLSSWCYIV